MSQQALSDTLHKMSFAAKPLRARCWVEASFLLQSGCRIWFLICQMCILFNVPQYIHRQRWKRRYLEISFCIHMLSEVSTIVLFFPFFPSFPLALRFPFFPARMQSGGLKILIPPRMGNHYTITSRLFLYDTGALRPTQLKGSKLTTLFHRLCGTVEHLQLTPSWCRYWRTKALTLWPCVMTGSIHTIMEQLVPDAWEIKFLQIG